jgi:hypothetical protein
MHHPDRVLVKSDNSPPDHGLSVDDNLIHVVVDYTRSRLQHMSYRKNKALDLRKLADAEVVLMRRMISNGKQVFEYQVLFVKRS